MGSRESGAQKHKDHAQDCGTLIAFARSASGDPAMVFVFRMASILSAVTGTLPCPATGLLLDVVEHDPCRMMLLRMVVPENSESVCSEDHAKTRANSARTLSNQRRMLCFSSNAL
jgi:hypothetical protein